MEPSKIVVEGLVSQISLPNNCFSFFYANSLKQIQMLCVKSDIVIIIINPVLIQNKIKLFKKLYQEFSNTTWIGIVYSYFDNSILNLLDDKFSITDNVGEIRKKIFRYSELNKLNETKSFNLSEREVDVLKLLANGLSNKEIADKLNISVYTVNTHRKNIMDKTEIRTLAGLTIYSVSKGYTSVE